LKSFSHFQAKKLVSIQRLRGILMKMKALLYAGLVLVVLGIASLVVPIPHTESHGMNAGDMHIGIQTSYDERVSPIVSVVLIASGIALAVVGTRTGMSRS
jgi:hypothetical protein